MMSPRFASASSTTTATATAQLGRRAAYSEPDSMEVYNDLVVGKYNWVPDDAQPGPAAAEMENLPIHWLKDWMLCLDVECGIRAETVLHWRYGTVTSYEREPAGCGSPLRATIRPSPCPSTGSSRSPATGSGGQAPAHEPYEEQRPPASAARELRGRSRRYSCPSDVEPTG
ncbi:hypothetical protein [Streptomyces phaeochromogenes]